MLNINMSQVFDLRRKLHFKHDRQLENTILEEEFIFNVYFYNALVKHIQI
ncbi:MAG: hypothetical protein ACI9RP_002811 [Cyclobacteriaceae bacterium]